MVKATPCRSHAGTVVPECFKNDIESQWKSGKFDPRFLSNPWTDRHLNLYGWLRRRPLPLSKISSRYDYPPLPLKYVKRLFFLVFPSAYSQDPCTDFHDQYVKWRGFAQACAFLGVPKTKFYISTSYPSKRKFFANFRRDRKFRVKKALTVGMLACKLPLILIVAQWKLYSE